MTGPDATPRHRPAAQHLDTQVSYRLGVPLIYLKGELDHDSAVYLREIISEETKDDPAALVLDFSELTYMDSGGLSLMFDVLARFAAPRWLGVVAPRVGVLRLLEITGLSDREGFKILPDVQAASQALSAKGPV
ncbi:MAG TPA: STAS domain-containing protein [Thermoleophilia bacterium]|nr:STAS domain-containing protein [Thermoleophilia bacterium]